MVKYRVSVYMAVLVRISAYLRHIALNVQLASPYTSSIMSTLHVCACMSVCVACVNLTLPPST